MNDPGIRNQLKTFLDQQIKEKNFKRMEDHEAHKIGMGMFEPVNDATIKEFQIL